MKNKLWIVTIIFLILLLIVCGNSYSLFETNSTGDLESNIGEWKIKLNDVLISNINETTFTITDFQYTENEHTADGYIAPGRSGYYDLILDATDTDVAVKFDITLDLDSEYEENISMNVTVPSDQNIIRTDINTYSGVLTLDDIEDDVYKTLRINIEWEDLSSYDESDTETGLNSSSISIPVILKVTQYLGETITPYVE